MIKPSKQDYILEILKDKDHILTCLFALYGSAIDIFTEDPISKNRYEGVRDCIKGLCKEVKRLRKKCGEPFE